MREGRVLAGRYALVRPLGAGGSGLVFEARRLVDGAVVALKVLRPELAAHDEVVRRFLREAELAGCVRHPHLREVLDAGVDPEDGVPFLVQPLLRGVDLARALADSGPLAPQAAVALVVPVASALRALHAAGIVHRDVKPANVFLAEDDAGAVTPVLLDFGVAKHAAAAPLTATGDRLGTPAYMAPEQAEGRRDLDGRCDVWAVGVVLYELVTGENPFAARTMGESLHRVRTLRPPPLAGVSPSLSQAVARALEVERERRWPTMDALHDALRADLGAAPAAPARAGTPTPRRASAPRRALRWGVVAACAGVAVAVAVVVARRPASYEVRVSVAPPHATVTWNGRPLGAGDVTGTALRDGATHTLRFAAAGHEARTVVFRDAPPPPRVTLRPE